MINYKAEDINRQMANRAHSGTSFSPEQRGEGYVIYYLAHMKEVDEEFMAYATDENREELTQVLEDYRKGYIVKLNAMLAAKSRCISSMITGPSNFPVRRAEKANASADKRTQEYLDYIEKRLDRLRRTYNPRLVASAPIYLDDPDVAEKLEEKLARLERNQAVMVAVNKVIRDKSLSDEAKIWRLEGMGLEADLLQPGFMGNTGFAPFELSNNNANIKRLKDRIAQVEREQSREAPDKYDCPPGVEVIENTDITRIQFFFDDKPDEDVRSLLKSHGFHFSKREGNAWQRLLNENARYATKSILLKLHARVKV
jgi:hypothetical protein